jgi:uncharacterized protein (DUF362 family)
MDTAKVRVGLGRKDNRRDNVFAALDLVRREVVAKLGPQVMLKPNFLSSKNQLASTHVDAIRGAIDFLQTVPQPPAEILVAEGGNEDYSGQAFENFGYQALVEECPIPLRLVDLNQEESWQETTVFMGDGREVPVRIPTTVLECPCTISVAVAKTHDGCVVTLAQKNMIMGTLHKEDRIKMHGYDSHGLRTLPAEAQQLNINLMRVSRSLRPHIGVIDGTVGMQGNGPGGGYAMDLGIAVASADVFAADAVMASAMGFEPLKLGLLHYANELGYGTADLERIEVLGTPIEEVRQSFEPHDQVALQLQWQDARASQYLTAAS